MEHQEIATLAFKPSLSQRNYSDSPYLGGIAFNDSTSMCSMKLHDISFDKTFYANKSVFCFGNLLVCLGSNIQNRSTTLQTETTLFQQAFLEDETMEVNGAPCKESRAGIEAPIIHDNIGNYYIVKDGTVNMVKKGNLFTAYINHGMAPSKKSYAYFMLMKPSSAQVTKYNNAAKLPVSIIRNDTVAQIVNQKEQKIFAYAIFNSSTPLNDEFVQQVNSPSMVMLKKLDKGAISFMVSDPDMRRPSAAIDDVLTVEQKSDTGKVFDYQITINGFFAQNDSNSDVKLTYGTSTTTLTVAVSEGKTYSFNLKPLNSK